MLADGLVIGGVAAIIAGVAVQFGGGWALMVGGVLVLVAGARLEARTPPRQETQE